jgi:hypothetical protein
MRRANSDLRRFDVFAVAVVFGRPPRLQKEDVIGKGNAQGAERFPKTRFFQIAPPPPKNDGNAKNDETTKTGREKTMDREALLVILAREAGFLKTVGARRRLNLSTTQLLAMRRQVLQQALGVPKLPKLSGQNRTET